MAVLLDLNRKRGNLKGQVTKLISAITDEETMDMPQPEAQLEILKKIQEKSEVLKEDYYKSTSDEEYLTIEASLWEIDQEIQHLEEVCTCTSGAVVGLQPANPKRSHWIGTQKRLQ
ncbi:hypothetical protein NPIL_689181 [Nephila pilipes]|uniref:Uncharacterized protein n=1 Tax=Nephila pilipes TaxID=299642 RepID=A0A8X6T0D6_NEPPI|nr:hypothetical protein NPIL_689181 [Nephila pilipes]